MKYENLLEEKRGHICIVTINHPPVNAWNLATMEEFESLVAELEIEEMDLIEIQEAFAAQVLADLKEMDVGQRDYDKVNVNGSGISLGHPIACTGTRVLVTLIHEMKKRNVRYGLECICGGGGLGVAAIFERR